MPKMHLKELYLCEKILRETYEYVRQRIDFQNLFKCRMSKTNPGLQIIPDCMHLFPSKFYLHYSRKPTNF